MGVTRALPGHNPIVGGGAWIFRHRHAEVGPHLHALENEIDTKTLLALHLPQVRPHVVFLARALLGPLERNAVVAGESLDPRLYSVVRWRRTSLVMGPMPCTSPKKCTMFSGRVSSGKWPRMTIRSKHWYTKVSRLPNNRVNSSIGPFASVPLSWHQELGTEDRWRSKRTSRTGSRLRRRARAFIARCQAGVQKFQRFLGSCSSRFFNRAMSMKGAESACPPRPCCPKVGI